MNITRFLKLWNMVDTRERFAAQAWLEKYNRRFGLFINGEFVEPSSAEFFESELDGELLGEVARANQEDVDAAVRLPARRKVLGSLGTVRARYLYA